MTNHNPEQLLRPNVEQNQLDRLFLSDGQRFPTSLTSTFVTLHMVNENAFVFPV